MLIATEGLITAVPLRAMLLGVARTAVTKGYFVFLLVRVNNSSLSDHPHRFPSKAMLLNNSSQMMECEKDTDYVMFIKIFTYIISTK